ncbi:hypothetical protein B0J12DRAFT_630636 [Macrophomina phaseolina]|uniref:Aconitase X catalytic domain-containing protein n=1 Tax=Macrophomina phaseolina TaxID=35725 RepID=A0ABQ8G0P6_9PEZI|nr:hypothetical protein B0J12DRAFT_630636 [Macrophomina phaseolina]
MKSSSTSFSSQVPIVIEGAALIPGKAQGALLTSTTPLSFWGGVNPSTGEVIDRHHPLAGNCVAGKILAIPSGRGSCSGSGVLLELLLSDKNPAALIFQREETILTLGVIVARELFSKSIPVIQLPPPAFAALSTAAYVQIEDAHIRCLHNEPPATTATGLTPSPLPAAEPTTTNTTTTAPDLALPPDFTLTPSDQHILSGALGPAPRLALRIILQHALLQRARSLLPVTRAHIDGCFYTGPGALLFARTFLSLGARVAVPSTLNAISIDRARWRAQGVDAALASAAGALADAYVAMGCAPTYTCAPYLLGEAAAGAVPRRGEDVGWAESNAVVFANSVLGARTAKYPDFLDLCVALTGKAPRASVHVVGERRARVRVRLPGGVKAAVAAEGGDAVWPLLGHVVGDVAAERIPVVEGLEGVEVVTRDDLKAFGAAFATTSSAPMFHVAGVTPEALSEADLEWHCAAAVESVSVTSMDLAACWKELDRGLSEKVDLISLGNPHFSCDEMAKLAALCNGRKKSEKVEVIVTCGRETYMRATKDGYVDALADFGVQVLTDTCWCMIAEPVIPIHTQTIMTNSAKYAHYGAGLSGRQMRFGSMAQCVDTACSGYAPKGLPAWLKAP